MAKIISIAHSTIVRNLIEIMNHEGKLILWLFFYWNNIFLNIYIKENEIMAHAVLIRAVEISEVQKHKAVGTFWTYSPRYLNCPSLKDEKINTPVIFSDLIFHIRNSNN